MLNLLTTTGCRPQAFALCQQLMAAQDYRGRVHWIVVDDGEDAQPFTLRRPGWTWQVCRPRPFWRGQNTQARNLRYGLSTLGAGASVAIIEDDDYYAPGYLSAVAGWLEHADVVGESHARYYNVATRRFAECRNEHHASLCSTAVKGEGFDRLRRALGADWIDIELWRGGGELHRTQHVVGIKGLPGRAGIGAGHRPDFGKPDPDATVLRAWVGDAMAYTYLRTAA